MKSNDYDFIICTVCQATFGREATPMPKGSMRWTRLPPDPVKGFNNETFEIIYKFDSGYDKVTKK